jgi:methionyl-tRNA synthetase
MTQPKKLLVTSALPYANGQIHIGHLVEYIQTDIFVRFNKLVGNECIYICADDTHGTPIMLSAKNRGIQPEELIKEMHADHNADFAAFGIQFSHYGSTNIDDNRLLSELIYTRAKEAGAIYEKEIEQLYDPTANMFLPDRFVKGTCPKCKAPDQYGDSCEKCGTTYSPRDLINPISAVTGQTPIIKPSVHYFFKLSDFSDFLKDFITNGTLKTELKNKLMEWFEAGLKDWDISRDAPYFGFKIPGTDDKYFYVWLDAPVGYISNAKVWGDANGKSIDQLWSGDYDIHHFIGKDILYFHALFWPAMLKVSQFKLPDHIHVHGFLTINGEKMSKSRGTFITAKTYLQHLNPEFLRYYYAAKLSDTVEDVDLNLTDFVNRVNADIVNKFINIASRLASILVKKCNATIVEPTPEGKALLETIVTQSDTIYTLYSTLETHKAMRAIMDLADLTNQFIDTNAPWDQVKTDPHLAAQTASTGLTALKHLATYLKPVIPTIVEGIEGFLNILPLTWDSLKTPLEPGHMVNPYQHLAARLDQEVVNKITAV